MCVLPYAFVVRNIIKEPRQAYYFCVFVDFSNNIFYKMYFVHKLYYFQYIYYTKYIYIYPSGSKHASRKTKHLPNQTRVR